MDGNGNDKKKALIDSFLSCIFFPPSIIRVLTGELRSSLARAGCLGNDKGDRAIESPKIGACMRKKSF